MKKIKFIAVVIVLLFSGYSSVFSQILNIQKFINKSPQELINTIGKPVSYDDNNPEKIYMSYNLLSLVCLADQKGVFKAELTKNYTSKLEALEEINELISNSLTEGCVKDSISEYQYALYKQGVKTEITLTEFDDSPNIKLKVEAIRQEE